MNTSLLNRLLLKLMRRTKFILKPLRNAYKKYLNISYRRSYHAWAVNNELECFVESEVTKRPLVSIIVPVYNTIEEHLKAMVYSVVNQHYEEWELILVNASDDNSRTESIQSCTDIDMRIKIVDAKGNHGISANTNIGAQAAQGQYMAFLDHDDTLHPCALHTLILHVEKTNAELVYSDEDKVTHDGTEYFGPHCKPGWSLHLLENLNYITHLTLVKSEYVRQVKGFRPECDGAQDYDFLLRVVDECNPKIGHVPRVLYHWRAAESSTARNITTKTYIFKAGQKALQDHLTRKDIPAKAEVISNKPGFYRVTYKKPEYLSVVVGQVQITRQPACAIWIKGLLDKQEDIKQLVIGEWFQAYMGEETKVEVTLVNNDQDYLKKAVSMAKGEVVIYFQEASSPHANDDLSSLAAVALHSSCYGVQPVIVRQDNTIIDEGLVDAPYGLQPLFKGFKLGENTFFGDTDWVRRISGISCNIFAMKKTHLEQLIKDREGNFIKPDWFTPDKVLLVWPHTAFTYESHLYMDLQSSSTFNPQLTQSMYEVLMKSSTWNNQNDRDNE